MNSAGLLKKKLEVFKCRFANAQIAIRTSKCGTGRWANFALAQ
jgi:hypothetical protein